MDRFKRILAATVLAFVAAINFAAIAQNYSPGGNTNPGEASTSGQQLQTNFPGTIPEQRFRGNVRAPNQLIIGGAQTVNDWSNGANQWLNIPSLVLRPFGKYPKDNLDTTITWATPSAARALTIPDVGQATGYIWTMANAQTAAGVIKRADLNVELYDEFPIFLQEVRNNDGSALTAAGAAGQFKIVNGGVGVGTLNLSGETANTNTKTDTFCKEVQLLDEYNAGSEIAVDVNCQYATGGAPTLTTKTLTVTCYKQNNDGTATSVPLTGGVITLTSANVLSTVTVTTPGTFNPGDRLMFYFQSVLTETGGVNVNAQVNGVNFKYDVKG